MRRPASDAQAAWLALAGVGSGALFILISAQLSPFIAIAALVGAIGFAVLVRNPVLGLYFTAAVVPLERMGRFVDDSSGITISLMRVIGLAALGALVLNYVLRRKSFNINLPMLLFSGYSLIVFASMFRSEDFIGGARVFASAMGHLLFFFLLINLTTTRKIALRLIVIWLLASGCAALYSGYDWHFGSGADGGIGTAFDPGKGAQTTASRFSTVWEDRAELESLDGLSLRRSMGPTSHAAVYGINLLMTLPFLLFCLKLPINWRLIWLSFGALGLTLYNVFLTNTRATILLAGVVGLICVARGLFKVTRPMLVAGAVGLLGLLVSLPADVYNRILDLSNYSVEKSASLRIRVDYVDAGLRAFADHPIFGIGTGNFHVIPQYFRGSSVVPEETSVHNEYLQTLIEVGLLGSAFFFAFVFMIFRYAIRAGRIFSRYQDTQQEYWMMVACQICMVSVLIFGLQVDVFHFPLQGWWLVAGITCAMYRIAIDYEQQQFMGRVAAAKGTEST